MAAWANRRAGAPRGPRPAAAGPAKRHGRRPIRSSITGQRLPNPDSRQSRFELAARSAVELLQEHLGDEMRGIHIGFASAPPPTGNRGTSEQPMLYTVDRAAHTIVLYRVPIQRARGLHVNDEEHRALFVGNCVYRAVCEYLGRSPWELLPGHFDHY